MTYEEIIKENKKWIDETFQKLDKKFSKTAIKSRNKIPFTTVNGVHDDASKDAHRWTNGFWGGLMWLMYEATGNKDYMLTARESEKMLDACFNDYDKFHHDVGFMWHLVSGASYRLTGDKLSRTRNLLAASILASRYNIKGEFIRPWNEPETAGYTIIDCLMNLSILYWASEEVKDDRFKHIAVKQADLSLRDHLRADGTVNHIVVHDRENPGVVKGTLGGQGYKEGSCWSRGHGWAVYGFILSFIHTGDEKYLEGAKRAADAFIEQTEKTGWLPRCDFMQPETPEKWDSTAGAIASCGLIEIAKNTSGKTAEKYLTSAINILKAMDKNWCDWSDGCDSVLQMGLEAYHYGEPKHLIYGDFFFTEAILKLKGSKFLIW